MPVVCSEATVMSKHMFYLFTVLLSHIFILTFCNYALCNISCATSTHQVLFDTAIQIQVQAHCVSGLFGLNS